MPKLCAIVLIAILAQLGGCAYSIYDTPWDPPGGRAKFTQIPNWDSEANKICGGHLAPEDMKPGMSRRC